MEEQVQTPDMDNTPNEQLEESPEDEPPVPSSGLNPISPSSGQSEKVDPQRSASRVSIKSDRSMDHPFNFKDGQHSTEQRVDPQRSASPAASCVSTKSDWSMDHPFNFKDGQHSTEQRVGQQRPESPAPSCVSMKSDWSMDHPFNFKDGQHATKKRKRECGKKPRKKPEVRGKTYKDTGYSNVQKVKANFKNETRKRFSSTHEGNGKQKSLLSSIYTTLNITPEESEDFSEERELSQIRKKMKVLLSPEIPLIDIFKPLPGQENQHQILTKGIAGIGKSFTVQKVALDWAEEKANNDIDFLFVLAFREINMCEGLYSLNKLLMKFYPVLKELSDPLDDTKFTVAIILDGLDESRLTFNFLSNELVTSLTQEASVDVVLTSLIMGKLLPSARLWITSRTAAANQIPAQYVSMVTEIRGFNDTQKEVYFKNKFAEDPDLADHVISNMQSSPSLHVMCHIPIICWIVAEVFQETCVGERMLKMINWTMMMSHYVLVQTRRRSSKYDQKTEVGKKGKKKRKTEVNNESLLKSHREQLLGLGRLAFEHLKKNSLIFYEKDFEDCKVDITEASIYSGFCAILKEERVFAQQKVFSFVHLTVQEFFAALYVYDCFINKNIDEALSSFLGQEQKACPNTLPELLKTTINKVLDSKNGQFHFFLRFLLGLTCVSNRECLSGLLSTPEDETSSENTSKKILTYLKTRRKGLSPDSCINLFQCMVEMRDTKVKEDIEEYLKLEDHSTELKPLHCSALAYTLLVSKEELKEFDLGSYNTSEDGRIRLIPAVTCSSKASLAECNLSEEFVKQLVPSLKSPYSALRELDLTNSDLQDVGVELLTDGLKSPNCGLTKLSLSGCQVTEKSCTHLATALRENSHLRELDLSYNHLGDGESMLMSELKNKPDVKLNVEHGGPHRIKSGFKKYACELTLDPSTANKNVLLSEGNRKVTWVKEEHPDLPRPFQSVCQVLCSEELKERSYWEVEVSKPINIGVTYAAIMRKGNKNASLLGSNEKSWSVSCSDEGSFASHNGKKDDISCKCSRSCRLGVYLDWSAGTLAFYRVSLGKTTLLHRFKNEFTESLHVGFEVYPQSSVTLCQLT